MTWHGLEVFESAKMTEYAGWMTWFSPAIASLMAYIGKSAELISGMLITLGLFTRIAVWPMIFTMLYIAFVLGKGKVWYEDQHPFLFVLLGLLFFFRGSGKYSLDHRYFSAVTGLVIMLIIPGQTISQTRSTATTQSTQSTQSTQTTYCNPMNLD